MIGLVYVAFWLLDGLVRGNTSPEAAPWRAGMMAALVIVCLIGMWRARVRVPPAWGAMIGILSALSVAEIYHYRPTGGGLSTWVIYALVLFACSVSQRDWTRDLALAGLVIGGLVLVAAPAGFPPGGMFNRNMVAATLVALAPATWARWRWWAAVPFFAAVITGSRGALAAGLAGIIVLARPWERIGGRWSWLAAPGAALLAAGLVAIRPATVMRRVECLGEVMVRWWASSPMFGLGPTFMMKLDSWGGAPADDAHSLIPTLAAQAGIVGLFIIALAIGCLVRRPDRLPTMRWQWATLAAVGTLSIIEDVAAWWPVGIVAVMAIANLSQVHIAKRDGVHVDTT